MPSALLLIWTTAWVLVAVSCCALGALIVARLAREREERNHPNRRALVSKALLNYAFAGGETPSLPVARRAERQVLIDVALDAALILRGPSKTRLVELLQALGLDRELRRRGRKGSVRDRVTALESLCLFPDAQTIAVLCAAEQSSDLRIWLTALRARVELGVGPDISGLLDLAGRSGASRSSTMHDLVTARARENLHEALRALNGDVSVPARALLVRAIGETGRREALAPLKTALCHPNPQVRSAAAGALGALGYAEAADALARATCDGDWRVRLKAIEAIKRLGLGFDAACLKPLLQDRIWWVRFRAEEALRGLGEEGDALQPAASSQIEVISRSALR